MQLCNFLISQQNALKITGMGHRVSVAGACARRDRRRAGVLVFSFYTHGIRNHRSLENGTSYPRQNA